MTEIYVDADACPVRDEVLKVAARHNVMTVFVSDGGIRPPNTPLAHIVIVSEGADAADNWIHDHVETGDVVVTNDIPLADRCLKKNAHVIRPDGRVINEDQIGMALATRDLMTGLRETGTITGGPAPFSRADRSRFLNALEVILGKALKSTKP